MGSQHNALLESPPHLSQPQLSSLEWSGKLVEDCVEITVESRGGAAGYHHQLMGVYTRDDSLWEEMLPIWTSDNGIIAPDLMSNPALYYIKWLVYSASDGFGNGIKDNSDSSFGLWPYDIPGEDWIYKCGNDWCVDTTLTINCSMFNNTLE